MRLSDPVLVSATGAGVRVAVIDSGIAPGHPHVGRVAGGCWLTADGESADWGDRIGHGTAVAAAIREKAPECELLAVRVFGNRLATNAAILVRAIDVAVDRGARLVNLSLGTENVAHRDVLADAVRRASARGALVVAAAPDGSRQWLPGALTGVVSVSADAEVPRDTARIAASPLGVHVICSPYPRPVEGVPVERNLTGSSFAVANATGMLARFLGTIPSRDDAAPPLPALHEALAGYAAGETATKG